MGYDLHITRKAHWADEGENNNISLAEFYITYYIAA
jgi:hypothetical protein